MKPQLDIIQPFYNPRDGWAERYIGRFAELKRIFNDIDLQVIMVNDGSIKGFDENTELFFRRHIPSLKIISYPVNKGKGYAVREGVKHADAPYILYTDYDFPYDMSCLREAYDKLLQGNDIVVGIRHEDYYHQLSLKRKLVSKACNILNRTFLKIPHTDTQSGLKAFNPNGKRLMLNTIIDRFLFDTEFVCMAYQDRGIRVSTIDIKLRPGVKFTGMSFKTILHETKNFISVLIRSAKGEFKK